MRFLPAWVSMAVLPPMEESTIDNSVVGIWITGMPRMNVDAMKPF